MKSFRAVSLILALISLTACEEKAQKANVCSALNFEPAELNFLSQDAQALALKVSLLDGTTTLKFSAGEDSYICNYQMSAADLSGLKQTLSKGVTYCPVESGRNVAMTFVNDTKVLNVPSPTDNSLKIDGGYTRFETDIRSYIEEVKAKGTCTGVINGQPVVGGTPVSTDIQ